MANKKENGSSKSVSITKDIKKTAEEIIQSLLDALDTEADFEVDATEFEDENDVKHELLQIKIEGEDVGALIGFRGQNLRALQSVFSQILHRKLEDELEDGGYIRVSIDVSGYRENREESLKDMAERIRDEVIASGEPVDLPPMSGFERRVIHVHVLDLGDVESESFGEGRERHVRISPKEE